MSVLPKVFVSATSSDLGTARDVTVKALNQIDCTPVEQSISGTEYGKIRELLRRWIDPCDAVIHIVGRDYGGEPKYDRRPRPSTDQYGKECPTYEERRSWTQMEYDYAIALNNLATLLLGTNRPAEAEPLMRCALAISAISLAQNHPNTLTCRKN